MKDRKSMLGVFAALLGAFGGHFEPVKPDTERKRHSPAPKSWWRLSSDEGYNVVHGTRYRTWTKTSKKDRSRRKRLAKRKAQAVHV